MKLTFSTLVAIILAGCAVQQLPKLPPKQAFLDIPLATGSETVSTARVGNSVVQKAKLYERPAKLLAGEIVHKHLLSGTTVLGQGKYAALYEFLDSTYYAPTEGVETQQETEMFRDSTGLIVRDDGRHYTGYFMSNGLGFVRNDGELSEEQIALISNTTHVDLELPSFKQEFVYNGVAESIVRFMYREYKDDMARPAFTQNLVYDLNQSNRIVFQSVELEVIEANNAEIKYRLLSGFPDYE